MLIKRLARRYAETMLYWRGHLRAREVQDYLGVSERTARSLIAGWRRFDGILPRYRRGPVPRLVPDDRFTPGPAVTDTNITLSLMLIADRLPGNPLGTTPLPGGSHELALSIRPSSGAIRELIAACLDRRPVWVLYAAKSGRQEFVFHPGALIRSRGRYHLRGYRAEGRDAAHRRLDNRYVDVVPARSIEANRKQQGVFIGLDRDADWHVNETRRLVLSSELSSDERVCYEHEYGIAETGVLTLTNRRALLPYLLQELLERRCWRRDGTSVPIWRDTTNPGITTSGVCDRVDTLGASHALGIFR